MILVLGGTADSRVIAEHIQAEGYQVMVSTATDYGGTLVNGIPVRSGMLDGAGFQELFRQHNINLVVDASHPFAQNVSKVAMAVCAESGVAYVRYERPEVSFQDNPSIFRVNSFLEAAKLAATLGECIFLGTGSNTLATFTTAPELAGKRLVVRVLPKPEIITKCLASGLSPANIVAMQGPFNEELNQAMFRHFNVQVLVSKEAGIIGGTDSKIRAALNLGIPVVLIERPKLDYPLVFGDWFGLKEWLAKWG